MNLIHNNSSTKFNQFLLALFIFSSTLPMTEFYSLNSYRNLILLGILVYLVIVEHKKVSLINGKGKLFIIWVIMGSIVGISTLFYDKDLLNFFSYLIISPYIFFFLFKKVLKGNIINLLKIGVLSSIPYLILSLLLYPDIYSYSLGYRGVFTNSNMMGLYTAFLLLCIILIIPHTRLFVIKTFYYILIILSCAILPASMSRTAIIALLLSLSILVFIKVLNSQWKFKKKHMVISYFFIIIGLIITLLSINGIQIIKENKLSLQINTVIEKNSYYAKVDNLTNGRGDIWRSTITDGNVLGHGENYFTQKYNLAAHNSIIEFYGRYGVLAAVLLTIFILCALYYSVKLVIRKKVFEPTILLIFFLCINMTETIFDSLGLGINVFYLMLFGILNNSRENGLLYSNIDHS